MESSIIAIVIFLSVITKSCAIPRHYEDEIGEDDLDHPIDSLSIKKRLLRKFLDDIEDASESKMDALTNLPSNGELFEEDIVMDDRLRRAVLGEKSKKSALVSDLSERWPNGIIYYQIHESFLPEAQKLLDKAIHEFSTRTCIQIKKRTDEENYVEYRSDKDQCSSNIGMTRGKQIIYIGKHCLVLGTVLHETMHVLGIIHEHSRPDRDQYIKVKFSNIEKDEWNNFNKYSLNDVDDENVEYNFASVMHYRNDAFTKNGKDTILALDEPNLQFGQRIEFSVGDVKQINTLYNCDKKLKTPNYHGLFKTYNGIHNKKDIESKGGCREKHEYGSSQFTRC